MQSEIFDNNFIANWQIYCCLYTMNLLNYTRPLFIQEDLMQRDIPSPTVVQFTPTTVHDAQYDVFLSDSGLARQPLPTAESTVPQTPHTGTVGYTHISNVLILRNSSPYCHCHLCIFLLISLSLSKWCSLSIRYSWWFFSGLIHKPLTDCPPCAVWILSNG